MTMGEMLDKLASRPLEYKLVDRVAVACTMQESLAARIESISTDGWVVKQEHVGDIWVSTVFLGLDQSWSLDGPPLVFETMSFHWPSREKGRRGPPTGGKRLYPTWEQAEQGHAETVARWEKKL